MGFYWTFRGLRPITCNRGPAPLSPADAADRGAQDKSFTIAEQRYAAVAISDDLGGDLIGEFVYQEKNARTSRGFEGRLREAVRFCESSDATLIVMQFERNCAFRPHPELAKSLDRLTDCKLIRTVPSEDLLSHFDWHRHWSMGRSRKLVASKQEARDRSPHNYYLLLLRQIDEFEDRDEPKRIAIELNERGFPTFSGRRWTADTVRKARQHLRGIDSDAL